MNRALVVACATVCLLYGNVPAASAQKGSARQPAKTGRATPVNLSYDVRITPTAMRPGSTSIEVGGDTWNVRGFDLKTLIAQIYDVDLRRIDFAEDGSSDARYDVTLSLPREIDQDAMQRLLVDAFQRKFGVTISAESRPMDVYVMSAPSGPGAALHRHGAGGSGEYDGGRIAYVGKECSGVASGGIEVSASTIPDFTRTLEPNLDRVLVDETKLAGSYDFKIGNYSNTDELFKLLHDELGLVVTPTQRTVTVLTVRPAEALQAKL